MSHISTQIICRPFSAKAVEAHDLLAWEDTERFFEEVEIAENFWNIYNNNMHRNNNKSYFAPVSQTKRLVQLD